MNNYYVGQVKYYNHKKGYGFITALQSNNDYYVRYNAIRPTKNIPLTKRSLWEGEFVEFMIDPGLPPPPPTTDQQEKRKGPVVTFVRGIGDYPMLYVFRHNNQMMRKSSRRGPEGPAVVTEPADQGAGTNSVESTEPEEDILLEPPPEDSEPSLPQEP